MTVPTNELERRFDAAMMDIYRRAKKEAGYNSTLFLRMLLDNHGLETARMLLHSPNVSEGSTALWERQKLKLTVEYLILQPGWHSLFTDEEREIARKRLKDYGIDPPS